jgi:hypothetical protein
MYGGRMNYLQRLRDMGDAPSGDAQDGGGMGGGPAELRRRFPTGLWNGDGEERMGGPMGGPVGDMPPWGSGGTPGPMPLPPSGPTGWKTPPTGGLDMVGPGGGLGGPQEGPPWGGGGGPMPVPWDRWRQLTMPEAPVYNQNGVRINEPPAKQWDSNSWANAQNGTGTKGGGGIDYGPLGQQGNSVWNGTAYVPQGTADPIMQRPKGFLGDYGLDPFGRGGGGGKPQPDYDPFTDRTKPMDGMEWVNNQWGIQPIGGGDPGGKWMTPEEAAKRRNGPHVPSMNPMGGGGMGGPKPEDGFGGNLSYGKGPQNNFGQGGPAGPTPGGPAGPGGMHELPKRMIDDGRYRDPVPPRRPGGPIRRPGGFMGGPQPSPAPPRPKPDFGQELGSRSGGGFQWGRNPFRMK